VRMCADGVKASSHRYLYPNAISGIIRIGRDEGLGAFTKGLGPNVVRSVLMSEFSPCNVRRKSVNDMKDVSQIAVYDEIKVPLI
jgi:hypothetical protein